MRIHSILPFLACLIPLARLSAADLQCQSGAQKTHLLELFTSEGCSSCPPAEAWMSRLKTAPGLWKNFVPLAFHVDYWDRLGWRDPFASKEWTARQYRYSTQWNSGSVYTPGFVLDGREWQRSTLPSASESAVGILRVNLSPKGELHAEFHPEKGEAQPLDLHVARLGFDLQSNVTAGENNGRHLRQDFVVLSLKSTPMQNGQAHLDLPPDERAGGIAAWITRPGETESLQACGGLAAGVVP